MPGVPGCKTSPGQTPAVGLGFPSLYLHQTNGVTGNTTSQAVEQEVGRDLVSFWERDPGGTGGGGWGECPGKSKCCSV